MKNNDDKMKLYWQKNKNIIASLLAVWFFVAYVLAIFLADQLNEFKIGGAKLGFWFAHQGAIYVFVVLIFVYVNKVNKLDKKFDVEE